MPGGVKKSDRIRELEAEVYGLKVKLDRSETKLHQAGERSMKISQKETEEELKDAHKRVLEIKAEKVALMHSVEELQRMLTLEQQKVREMEQGLAGLSRGPGDVPLVSVEHSVKRSERERELEMQLIKAKREKEKAVRLVVTLLGRDNVAEFLHDHAGSPSILDDLIGSFAPGVGRYTSTGISPMRFDSPKAASHIHTAPSSPKRHGSYGKVKSTLVGSPDPSRNRIDDFFR